MSNFEEDEEMTDEEVEFSLRLGGGSDIRETPVTSSPDSTRSQNHKDARMDFESTANDGLIKILDSFEEGGKVVILAKRDADQYVIATYEKTDKQELNEYGFYLPYGRNGINKVLLSKSQFETIWKAAVSK